MHEECLHTLGNLTLTAYNPNLSNHTFSEKRDKEGKGLRYSPLFLNRGLGEVKNWDEDAIKVRAERLTSRFLEVWPAPNLPAEVLDEYRPEADDTTGFSIDDHPNLHNSPTRELFEAFRNQVMELDPGVVREEFWKNYVAYKADRNFVVVDPLAKQLKLGLNIDFSEIRDERGICVDISGRGSSVSYDVEVRLSQIEDLPYIIGLVRQALDRQLDNAGEG